MMLSSMSGFSGISGVTTANANIAPTLGRSLIPSALPSKGPILLPTTATPKKVAASALPALPNLPTLSTMKPAKTAFLPFPSNYNPTPTAPFPPSLFSVGHPTVVGPTPTLLPFPSSSSSTTTTTSTTSLSKPQPSHGLVYKDIIQSDLLLPKQHTASLPANVPTSMTTSVQKSFAMPPFLPTSSSASTSSSSSTWKSPGPITPLSTIGAGATTLFPRPPTTMPPPVNSGSTSTNAASSKTPSSSTSSTISTILSNLPPTGTGMVGWTAASGTTTMVAPTMFSSSTMTGWAGWASSAAAAEALTTTPMTMTHGNAATTSKKELSLAQHAVAAPPQQVAMEPHDPMVPPTLLWEFRKLGPEWKPSDIDQDLKSLMQGKYAHVYQTRVLSTNQPVVIKRFPKYHALYAYHEARMHFPLKHPRIVEMYAFIIGDATTTTSGKTVVGPGVQEVGSHLANSSQGSGENSGYIDLVMEYMPGGDVFETLVSHMSHPERGTGGSLVWRILQQVGEALYYLHQRHLVHGDIKPENLLFDAEQRNIKLADFDSTASMKQTPLVTVFEGTTFYMPPECVVFCRAQAWQTYEELYGPSATLLVGGGSGLGMDTNNNNYYPAGGASAFSRRRAMGSITPIGPTFRHYGSNGVNGGVNNRSARSDHISFGPSTRGTNAMSLTTTTMMKPTLKLHPSIDMWSVGIMMYEFYTLQLPFFGGRRIHSSDTNKELSESNIKTYDEALRHMHRAQWAFRRHSAYHSIPTRVRELISALCKYQPLERMDASQFLHTIKSEAASSSQAKRRMLFGFPQQ